MLLKSAFVYLKVSSQAIHAVVQFSSVLRYSKFTEAFCTERCNQVVQVVEMGLCAH